MITGFQTITLRIQASGFMYVTLMTDMDVVYRALKLNNKSLYTKIRTKVLFCHPKPPSLSDVCVGCFTFILLSCFYCLFTLWIGDMRQILR